MVLSSGGKLGAGRKCPQEGCEALGGTFYHTTLDEPVVETCPEGHRFVANGDEPIPMPLWEYLKALLRYMPASMSPLAKTAMLNRLPKTSGSALLWLRQKIERIPTDGK